MSHRERETIEVYRNPDGTWTNKWGKRMYMGEDAKILDRLFNKGEFEKDQPHE
jgi:hypothetical protein